MRVTILGCGGSGGVPLAGRTPGGFWGACDPTNPKNRRRRVSILVEEGGLAEEGATALLVDASPDLRVQMLDHDIVRLDALLFTHDHGDHCHGVDELRTMAFDNGGPIDAFMDAKTRDALTRRFAYIFASSADPASIYKPMLADKIVNGPFAVGDVPVIPFVQGHGPETTLGYRIGDVAYSTDLVSLDETAFAVLDGVKLWIVDCLRFNPHPTHAHFDLTMDWIGRVRPGLAVLTHMNHEVDYDEIAARCPPGVVPAYDGLVLEVG